MLTHILVQGQCNNDAVLKQVEPAEENLQNGKIDIEIISSGRYEAQLFFFEGAKKIFVKKVEGRQGGLASFDNLYPKKNYRVLVIFNDEEEAFCKNVLISDISTLIK